MEVDAPRGRREVVRQHRPDQDRADDANGPESGADPVDVVEEQAGGPPDGPAPARTGGWHRLRGAVDALFPSVEPAPRTLRRTLLAVVAVLVGTALSLLRTTGTGPLQSIWEEDARDILNDALLTSGFEAVTKPVAGYYVLVPRLLGEVATWFPLSWAAAVLSVSSALITALLALAVYVASGSHLQHPLARLLVSVPVLTSPIGENWLAEVYNRPVCLHFFAMYAVFWMLLWTPAGRAGRAGRVAVVTIVGLTAFSTIIAVFFVPLAALRLWARRDVLSASLLGLLVAAAALNMTAVDGEAGRGSALRLDPVWAAANFVATAVPHSVFGYRATDDLINVPGHGREVVARNLGVISLSWLLLLAVVVVAVLGARRGVLRPAWGLAVLAGAHSVWLSCLMMMANGGIAMRYLPPVEMVLFTALVALLRPTSGAVAGSATAPTTATATVTTPAAPAARTAGWRSVVPLSVFAVFLLVISAANFRFDNTYRAHAPKWTGQVAQATARCNANPALAHVVVRGGPKPYWSIVVVPCDELRGTVACPSPYCEWLDPPSAAPARRENVPG